MARRSGPTLRRELLTIPGTLLVALWTPLGGLLSLARLRALPVGRVFRRLGLPVWTLVGIGAVS